MKQRKIIRILIIVVLIGLMVMNVYAAPTAESTCEGFFGDPTNDGDIAYYLQLAFNVMKYIGIVLCVVLSVVDAAKQLVSGEKESKALVGKIGKRIAYAIALFFLPTILNIVMRFVGAYSVCVK